MCTHKSINIKRCFQSYQEFHRAHISIDDLPKSFRNILPFLFADVTKYLHSSKSLQDQTTIQEDLNKAGDWSLTSNMMFNKQCYNFGPVRKTLPFIHLISETLWFWGLMCYNNRPLLNWTPQFNHTKGL